MAEFPPSPIPPSELLEKWLPQAFAEAEQPPGTDEADVKLGVRLDGEGGGEWVVHLAGGKLSIEAGSRDETAFTYFQSVDDWRGSLWEDRGGAIGRGASAIFRPGAQAEQPAAGGMGGGLSGGAPSPAAMQQMQVLNGLIKMEVTGDAGQDWSVSFKLGPGEIPEEPTATVSITAEDAAAMEKGELDPMQAFMSGRIRVVGDMALIMQMQAIQMQAATQAASSGGGDSSP